MLLSALGVPDNVLLERQQEYFDLIMSITTDASVALDFLLAHDQVAEKDNLHFL